ASVETRRMVAPHDQSSTCAPRSRIRCPPGCQTLMTGLPEARYRVHARVHWETPPPRPTARAYRRKTHACVTKACRDCKFGARSRRGLHALRELALERSEEHTSELQ